MFNWLFKKSPSELDKQPEQLSKRLDRKSFIGGEKQTELPKRNFNITKEDIYKKFNKLMEINPLKFDKDYLDQIKLEIIELKDEGNDWCKVTYELNGFNYRELFKHTISSTCEADTFAQAIYQEITCSSDLMKKDEKTAELIDMAAAEAKEFLNKSNRRKISLAFWGWQRSKVDKNHYLGDCHILWAEQKRILKEKYNIDWKTPAERNPDVKFD